VLQIPYVLNFLTLVTDTSMRIIASWFG